MTTRPPDSSVPRMPGQASGKLCRAGSAHQVDRVRRRARTARRWRARCRRSRRGCARSAWAGRWCRRTAGTPRPRGCRAGRRPIASGAPGASAGAAAHRAVRSVRPGPGDLARRRRARARSVGAARPRARAAIAWWSKPRSRPGTAMARPRCARPGSASSCRRWAGSAITGMIPARRQPSVRTTNCQQFGSCTTIRSPRSQAEVVEQPRGQGVGRGRPATAYVSRTVAVDSAGASGPGVGDAPTARCRARGPATSRGRDVLPGRRSSGQGTCPSVDRCDGRCVRHRSRLLPRRRPGEGHHDGVERDQAVGGDPQRVDLDRLRAGLPTSRSPRAATTSPSAARSTAGPAAEPVQQRRARPARRQSAGLVRRERGGRDGDVGERLGHRLRRARPARPGRRPGHAGPDDQVDARRRHRLDQVPARTDARPARPARASSSAGSRTPSWTPPMSVLCADLGVEDLDRDAGRGSSASAAVRLGRGRRRRAGAGWGRPARRASVLA